MHTMHTTAEIHGFRTAIIMQYRGRTRVRYIDVTQPLSKIQEIETQFLKDMGARGKVRRKGRIV